MNVSVKCRCGRRFEYAENEPQRTVCPECRRKKRRVKVKRLKQRWRGRRNGEAWRQVPQTLSRGQTACVMGITVRSVEETEKRALFKLRESGELEAVWEWFKAQGESGRPAPPLPDPGEFLLECELELARWQERHALLVSGGCAQEAVECAAEIARCAEVLRKAIRTEG